MRTHAIVLSALLTLWSVAGCADNKRADDRFPPATSPSTPTSNTTVPDGSSSAGSGRVDPGRATPAPDTQEGQRGNTPPGMDRSGGGPMDGAVRDPAGAVTKQPEPKTPVQ